MEKEMPSKKMNLCKACGKEIAKSAIVCPHCGVKNKKPIFKRGIFWILAVLIVMIAFFLSLEDVKESNAVINGNESITSTELLQAHDNNPINFAEQYNNSTVTVTSTIKEILPHGTFNGRTHTAVLKLYGNWWVEVSDSTAKALSPDDEVTITGTLTDVWNSYLWVSNAILS